MGQGVFGLAGASLLFSLPVLTQRFGAVAGSLADVIGTRSTLPRRLQFKMRLFQDAD